MSLTPILWFEIGIAILLGIAILWTKPQYALFLYGLALGFPDVAFPAGDAINIRMDDLLLPIFLARAFLWRPATLSPSQKKISARQFVFLAACLLSLSVETATGAPLAPYETAKMAGCAAIVFVLPRIVQTEARLRFLIAGLVCGGAALVIQILQHLGASTSKALTNVPELKAAATFSTWNGNTIGQAAMLLIFAASLGAIVFSHARTSRILWSFLATGFALVPFSMFVRGTSLSIAAGFFFFLCLMRRWKWALLLAAACVSIVFYLHASDRQLIQDATRVDLASGDGFSHRFERWEMSAQAIQAKPFLGQGFGQEWIYLSYLGSEGRAHDAYLTVWLELGLGGLLLFLAAIFQFVRAGHALYSNPRFQLQGALILALMLALALDSLGLPTLYWEKLPTIALSLAAILIGICERGGSPVVEKESLSPAREALAPSSQTRNLA